ncbi:MAG: hypothetical protein QOJ42_6287 [Acidobacteriaceae bacterium]|nr:hypothetical protein [Acidobacteriaceae bacterium]
MVEIHLLACQIGAIKKDRSKQSELPSSFRWISEIEAARIVQRPVLTRALTRSGETHLSARQAASITARSWASLLRFSIPSKSRIGVVIMVVTNAMTTSMVNSVGEKT